ncbi:GntR family transcriptional regulator [Nonomuraea guangzhouensis]|uniref:GntR family transcriptional regulator n=1 Tax=Nonomuraea guangzhouensis TaxID=1291555 RepID=A0ABW4GTW1_9ACTN|nr:GntR family transcriptional regulator [Nonomuraea guangzhouensis]
MTDQVFKAIRAAIMNGEMPAGYRLRIRDIAAQVGTSVMPVREAIRRLEEAGLAERVPHKGAVVKGLGLTELAHLYDVRRLMEVEAARLGAERIEPADVDRMQQEYDQMRAAIDAEQTIAVLDHDEALLTILYQASGNPVLVSTIQTLWERCRSYKIVGAQATLMADDKTPLWSFQARLLEAARSNEPGLAAKVNNESLLNATARIRDQLAVETEAGKGVPLRGSSSTGLTPIADVVAADGRPLSAE